MPVAAFTATATARVQDDIVAQLGLQSATLFKGSFNRPNLYYTVKPKGATYEQLRAYLWGRRQQSGIVYCQARATTEEVARKLRLDGVDAAAYHAGLESDERRRVQEAFQRGEVRVIVATIAFGMGIDKPDVRFVAHLDLPKSIEGYYQETGRAGRDGAPADAWMAYGLADVVQQRRLIDLSEASEDYKRVSAAKLDALLGLCETAGCRRVRLLDYFGETSTPCGNCDTCVAPPETFDATAAAQKALSAIYRTGQRFGAVHLIDVLRGKPGDRIARWDHDKLSVFGIGADLDETAWRVIFRQLVALGFARVDHTAHGALRLTEASRPLLRGDQQVAMRRAVARPRSTQRASRLRDGHEGAITAGDAALFERLKAWRLSEARAQSVPAFVILHDKTLADIARQRPRNLASLGSVSGIGAKKLERYGPALVELIGQGY